MSAHSPNHEELENASTFQIFYDSSRTKPTPYTSAGSYFKLAKKRIDASFDIIAKDVRGKDVLDVGASPFYFLYRAAMAGASSCHGTYFAHDAHPLKGASSVFSDSGRIDIHHSNIETDALPFEDDSFDIVAACEVLEHLEYFPEKFAFEARRVLRPGGLLCVTVPNVSRIANIAKLLLHKNIYMPYRSDPSGRHKHEYARYQLRALIDYMGLDIVKSGFISYSTSPRPFMAPINKLVGSLPGVRSYAPVLYVLARQRDPKPSAPLGQPPKTLFTSAQSIED